MVARADDATITSTCKENTARYTVVRKGHTANKKQTNKQTYKSKQTYKQTNEQTNKQTNNQKQEINKW